MVDRNGLIRHMVALLALSCSLLTTMSRQVFNQAIPDMTPRPNDSHLMNNLRGAIGENVHLIEPFFGRPESGDRLGGPAESEEDRYDWSSEQIGWIQSASSISYSVFMIPAGRLSELFGAKWVLFLCGFGSALCTLALPFLADQSYWLAVASRFALGLCQTGVTPSAYALLTRWMPAAESMVYLPLIKLALGLGLLLGCQLNAFESWRTAYYVAGAICLAWSAVWLLMVSSYPEQHRLISRRELAYIQQEVGDCDKARQDSKPDNKHKQSELSLWLKLFTNRMVLAFMAMKFTLKFSTEVQGQLLPQYFSNVLKMDRHANKNLMSLNFAIQTEFTLVAVYLTKLAVDSKPFGFGKTAMRRIFQGACNFGMASAYLILLTDMTSYSVACTAMVVVALSNTLCAGGDALIPVDLSPQYAASVMAIANSFANLSGIVVSPLVLWIVGEQQNWTLAWIVVAIVCTFGGLVFVLVIKAKEQPFDTEGCDNKTKLGKGSDRVFDITLVTLTAIRPLE